jgi:hypothetical protein
MVSSPLLCRLASINTNDGSEETWIWD